MLYFWQLMELTREFLGKMPGAEVHLHLDGAMPPNDIWEIAQRHKIVLPEIPEQSLQAVKDFYEFQQGETLDTSEKFDLFLRKFKLVIELLKDSSAAYDVALTHVRNLAQQNYVYAETRFAPQYSASDKVPMSEIIEGVKAGLDEGYDETGTKLNLTLSIGRECDVETARKVAREALDFTIRHGREVGLDLACNEADHPPEKHAEVFKETMCMRGFLIRRTVHVAEFPVDRVQRIKNMRTVRDDLYPNGYGHIIPLGGDPELVCFRDGVANSRIRVESCPLSNIITGAIKNLRELALDVLLRRGILASLNSDDPAIYGTSLADVYSETCVAYGFGVEHVRKFMRNAVVGAFCSEKERAWIFGEFEKRGMKL